MFHCILTTSLDQHAPEKSITKHGKKSVQPWVTSCLKKCISKQRKLFKHHLSQPSNTEYLSTYKQYKTCLQRALRGAKRLHYSNLCTRHKANTRRLWCVINEIIKKEGNKLNIIDSLVIDNIKIHDSQMIGNELGRHFSNIGKLYA